MEENLAPKIAELLKWNIYVQRTTEGYSTAIISRFKHSEIYYFEEAIIAVEFIIDNNTDNNSNSNKILVINDHLVDEPYQPYNLVDLNKNKHNHSQKELNNLIEKEMKEAHINRTQTFSKKLEKILSSHKDLNIPIFITGDHNEPSHLDWTTNAVKNEFCPFEVEWPTSKMIYDFGFIDSFRHLYPDEVLNKLNSWSPAEEDVDAPRHDRIDFIYHMNINVKDVNYIDSKFSDHLAVFATYSFEPKKDKDNKENNLNKDLNLKNK